MPWPPHRLRCGSWALPGGCSPTAPQATAGGLIPPTNGVKKLWFLDVFQANRPPKKIRAGLRDARAGVGRWIKAQIMWGSGSIVAQCVTEALWIPVYDFRPCHLRAWLIQVHGVTGMVTLKGDATPPIYPSVSAVRILMAERGLPRTAPNPDTLASPSLPRSSILFSSPRFPSLLFPSFTAPVFFAPPGRETRASPPPQILRPSGGRPGKFLGCFFTPETPKNRGLRPFWAFFCQGLQP